MMFYLLADSTALFRPSSLCLEHLSKQLGVGKKIAYVGAANGDEPVYFELFYAAMERVQPASIFHIAYPYSSASLQALAEADLVALAGGDVATGWDKLSDSAFLTVCATLKARNCSWLGISAGAIHLGAGFFNYLPWFIGAHEEADAWQQTRLTYQQLGFLPTQTRCLGLKSGAAIAVKNTSFEIKNLSGETLWLIPGACGENDAKG